MFGLGAVVLWTAVILPFTYLIYNFVQFYLEIRSRSKHIHKFPGDPPHPLWGHIREFPGPNEAGLKYMLDRAAEYSHGSLKVWYGPFVPTITTYKPETVKVLLKSSEPKPVTFGGYRLLKPWLGDGLLLSQGHKWSRNRRLLTPAFHFDILKPYMAVNNRCTEIFLNKLDQWAANDEYFEASNHVSLLTLDIMLRCAFSYQNDCQVRGESHPYVIAVNDLQETAVYRLLSPWLYPDWIFNLTRCGRRFNRHCDYVHSVSEEIIAKRRQTLESGDAVLRSTRYRDFLDTLLTARDEDAKGLTDSEIRDEVDTFLFEGHDTTSSGIAWTLYSLAANPEAQRRCQEEVDQILDGRNSDEILWEDLAQLKYTAMCIKEGLRLHTPVPFIERQTTKDMDIDGYFLPKGTVVDIQLYILHHQPDIWPEPMEFKPERFSPENIQKQDTYAFVPFSAGPRNCIGQNFAMHEMKSAIARIMRRFTLTLHPDKPVEHRVVVVMKTENGMYMKAKRRNITP